MPDPGGILAHVGYRPPDSPAGCQLDVVTPTCNRALDLIEQAAALGPQLLAQDRWIVVDDGSLGGAVDPRRLVQAGCPADSLLFVALSYAKGETLGTVNRARHAGCSLARPGSWIVEADDHDILSPGCLDAIRDAICRGAAFVYGDCYPCLPDGRTGAVICKPDYKPWLLRDHRCPCEGVRAFPEFLYRAAGGYRWHGPRAVGGNEFPAGDYGLFLRMEALTDGTGFYRIPLPLCRVTRVAGSITMRFGAQQSDMADALRRAARSGEFSLPG